MAKVKEDNHLDDSELLLKHLSSNLTKKGVIHIGAHLGEEVELYFEHGFTEVILVEANPNTYALLIEKFKDDLRVKCFNVAISNKTEPCVFRVYTSQSNNTESSSILPFDQFDKIVSTLKLKEEIEIMSYSIPDFINVNDISYNEYNMLVLDIQGADYLALQGANDDLTNFDVIITELNYISLYKNSKNADNIKDLLQSKNFLIKDEIVHTLFEGDKVFPAWGEAIFIKK